MPDYPIELYPFVALAPNGSVLAYTQTKGQAQEVASASGGVWRRRQPVGQQDRESALQRAKSADVAHIQSKPFKFPDDDFVDESYAFFSDEDEEEPVRLPQVQKRPRPVTPAVKPAPRQAKPEPPSGRDRARAKLWAQAKPKGRQQELRQRADETKADFEIRMITESRAGNMAAYAQWFELYRSRLERKVKQYISDDSAVDDILQDVLLSTWRKIHAVNKDAPAIEYLQRLFRFTVNRCLDWIQKEKLRQGEDLQSIAEVISIPSLTAAFPLASTFGQTSQDRLVAQRELYQYIEDNLLPKLHPSLAETFRLYCIEGLTKREIARKLRENETTVNTRILRVRSKLNDILGEGTVNELFRSNPAGNAAMARRFIALMQRPGQHPDTVWELRADAVACIFSDDVTFDLQEKLLSEVEEAF